MNIGYFEFNNQKINIKQTKSGFLFVKENKTDFSQEEKMLLKEIKNALTVKPSSSKFIKVIKLSKLYNLYYDFSNKTYFWLSEDNIYNEDDNRILNFNYNHQEEILYNKDYPNLNDNTFYKKIINFANKTIIIFLASSIALSMNFPIKNIGQDNITQPYTYEETQVYETELPEETIVYETDANVTEETIQEQKQITYIYEFKDVEDAIDKNPNLTEEEKNIIKSTKFIFDENHMYMDMGLVLMRLQTLKIEYDHDFDDLYTQGSYNIGKNIIKLRNKTIKGSLQEFIHEYLHMLQKSSNSVLMELSNQFFTNEVIMRLYEEKLLEDYYFYDNMALKRINNGDDYTQYTEYEKLNLLSRNIVFERGYMGYTGLYYVLVDMLPQEVLREYQFNPGDLAILVNALEKVEPNQNFLKAFDLVFQINELRAYNEDNQSWKYQKDVTELYDLLNSFYKSVKGKSITENPEMLLSYMMDDTSMIDKEKPIEENYEILNEYIASIMPGHRVIRLPKTYLSNIRSNSVLVLKNIEDDKLQYITIDENFKIEYLEFVNSNSYNMSLQ